LSAPYNFVSQGNQAAQKNPWSARKTQKAETVTTTTPKNSWDSLGSWSSGSNTTAFPTAAKTAVPTFGAVGTAPAITNAAVAPSMTLTPGTQANTGLTGQQTMPAWLSTDWSKNPNPQPLQDNRAAYSAYIAAMTPYLQTQQNAYQYGSDFNEAQRQYNLNKAWQMASDQYTQGLAGRTTDLADWQAQETARQWAATQAYQQQRDQAEMALTQYQTNQQVWGRNAAPNVRWMRSW
jgi:hypothetical protein